MWHNGISSFPWNATWQSMKGNGSFHIPSLPAYQDATHNTWALPIRKMCVSCHWCTVCILPPRVRSDGNKKRCRAVIQVKPYTSSSSSSSAAAAAAAAAWHPSSSSSSHPRFLFVLISFRVQPPGRQVKVYPRTTHHFPHMAPEGGTLEARGKGKSNSSHNIAAITTSNHTDRRTEILSPVSPLWIFVFLSTPPSPFFHHLFLLFFTPLLPFILLYIIDFCQ